MKYLLCLIGLILVIEGLPYFVFPDRFKSYLIKITEMPASTLRIFGLAAITIGLVLVYLGRT